MTKKIDGKTVSLHLKISPEVDKVAAGVANYKHFREIVGQSETICDARPSSPLIDVSVEPEDPAAAKKRALRGPSPRRSRRR